MRAMYPLLLAQMKKQLLQVGLWLDKAEELAKAKKFDPNTLLEARLAPDQFPLVRQVQATCDAVKLGMARVTGKDAPSHPDTEKTVDELRARIKATVAFLDTLTEKDFAEAATRVISTPRWEGKTMTGESYVLGHMLPNFYFHLTTVYALLRHNGVDVGKRDYLGQLTWRA